MGKCKNCGEKSEHIINGLCPDCLADKWGDIVEESPMISPNSLYRTEE